MNLFQDQEVAETLSGKEVWAVYFGSKTGIFLNQ
jgi:hypothetical protein